MILILLVAIITSGLSWALLHFINSDFYFLYFFALVLINSGMSINLHLRTTSSLVGFSFTRYFISLGALFLAVIILYLQFLFAGPSAMLFAPFVSLFVYQIALKYIYNLPNILIAVIINQLCWLALLIGTVLAPHGQITYPLLSFGLFCAMTISFPLGIKQQKQT